MCIRVNKDATIVYLYSRLAFFLQKRPVRCLLYNKFFNFHSPGKIFRIYIKHIIAQNLMFFVFEIVTFLAENCATKLAPKNYMIDTGDLVCNSGRIFRIKHKFEIRFVIGYFIAKI